MAPFFEANQDYLLFLSGLAFVTVAFSARSLEKLQGQPAWRWLGVFGLIRGVCGWLEMVALANPRIVPWASHVQAVLVTVAALVLIEFARRLAFSRWKHRIGVWVHLPLLAGAGLISLLDPSQALNWTQIVLSPLSAGIASCILWLLSWRSPDPAERRYWTITALTFPVAVSGPAFSALAAYRRSDLLAYPFSAETTPAITLVVAIFVSLLAVALNGCYSAQARRVLPAPHVSAWRRRIWISMACGWVLVGWIAAAVIGQQRDTAMRRDVLARCQLAAAAVPQDLVQSLEWSSRDLANPGYQRLKSLMASLVKANPDLRFVLLSGLREKRCYFLVDSESPSSPDYSPPGQEYAEAEADYLEAFATRKPFVLGPIADRWGVWVSGSVPLLDLEGGRESINLDLDVAAGDWNAAIRRERLPLSLITLLILSLLLVSFHMQERVREQMDRLALSEGHNKTLVEGSPDCVLMLDLNGHCLSVNRVGLASLGRSSAELIGHPFADQWPALVRPLVVTAIRESLLGKSVQFEADYVHPQGQLITWRVATNPVRDTEGTIGSIVCICTDVTGKMATERALVTAKEAAEAATRAKSEFLAVMSHEIRTPLGGVIGLLDLLRTQPQPPLQRRHTDMAADSAKMLLHILDDILDAAKVESGKLSIESIPFSLTQEFRRVLDGMRVRADAKGIQLFWDIAPTLPPVLVGDPTRLRQILANLLSNALKFTAQGGIHVSVTGDTSKTLDSVVLRVAVRDTGIGMPPEVRKRLFEKFEQADASTTRKFGGTGLGLSIVKGLVERMGGTIVVQSQPGVGSTFTFTLSLAVGREQDLPLPEKPAPTQVPRQSASLRLLCAEDDAINREIVGNLAVDLGHTIEFAMNGQEAVERLRSSRFDAVLMDNRMPIMDGFQATRLIRNPQSGVLDSRIPILAATANGSETYREDCIAAGMDDFLTKPLRAFELYEALERTITVLRQRNLIVPSSGPNAGATPPGLGLNPDTPLGLTEEELLAELDFQATDSETPTKGLAPEALQRILSLYFTETPLRIAEMKTGLAKNDFVTVGRAAHSLKSNSRYVQAEAVAKSAAELERSADQRERDFLESLIASVETAFVEFQNRACASAEQRA